MSVRMISLLYVSECNHPLEHINIIKWRKFTLVGTVSCKNSKYSHSPWPHWPCCHFTEFCLSEYHQVFRHFICNAEMAVDCGVGLSLPWVATFTANCWTAAKLWLELGYWWQSNHNCILLQIYIFLICKSGFDMVDQQKATEIRKSISPHLKIYLIMV